MDIYLSSPQVGLTVDGEESRLVFLDHPHGAIKLENLLNTYKYLHIYNIYNIYNIYSINSIYISTISTISTPTQVTS